MAAPTQTPSEAVSWLRGLQPTLVDENKVRLHSELLPSLPARPKVPLAVLYVILSSNSLGVHSVFGYICFSVVSCSKRGNEQEGKEEKKGKRERWIHEQYYSNILLLSRLLDSVLCTG